MRVPARRRGRWRAQSRRGAPVRCTTAGFDALPRLRPTLFAPKNARQQTRRCPQRMIRQGVSGLALRLYADNRNERARTQNRTPLLLVALRTNRVERIPFRSRPVRVQTVNANMAVKKAGEAGANYPKLNDSAPPPAEAAAPPVGC